MNSLFYKTFPSCKKLTVLVLFLFQFFIISAQNTKPFGLPNKQAIKSNLCFTENKGQISDQFFHPRPDVLFGGSDGKLTFHLKNNGISYQLQKVDKWKKDELFEKLGHTSKDATAKMIPEKSSIYRIDIDWVNSNSKPIIEKGKTVEGFANFYLASCPKGANNVMAYEEVTYKNIYSGIDLNWYEKNGRLKYDYYVGANSDHKNIKLEIKGAQKISINSQGELIIQTPFGEIVEEAPYVTQNGKQIKSNWQINKNIICFNIPQRDFSQAIVIDPGVRIWGTYYGGNSTDQVWGIAVEPLGNVYASGYTSSAGGTIIATVGSHQSVYGGGLENAFLSKFTSGGVRIWATYYGGNVRDVGGYCSLDAAGNIFMCGHSLTSTPGVIASPGAHQTVAGGDWDAFLVKFNSAGVRQWGTYYGGSGIDFGTYCAGAKDGSGDVYLTGKTQEPTSTVIATPNGFQTFYGGNEDAYIVKFNSAGVRQWGTYYGIEGAEQGNMIDTDASGSVYMVGQTNSTAGIATVGAYQTNFAGGNYDFIIAKFNNSGVRQWGTYYGGPGDDRAHGFVRDPNTGSLYITGRSSSTISVATDGSHQPNNAGGNFDALLVKLNQFGTTRDWATLYGGNDEDVAYSCAINQVGYVYIFGYVASTGTALATPGAHQTSFGGGLNDAFITQFNTLGNRVWGSYYGGIAYDLGHIIATDNNSSHVYIGGLSDAVVPNLISTAGSHQPGYGGGPCDGFFVKFYDCVAPPAPTNITANGNQNICVGNSSTLTVSGIGSINWFTVAVGGSSILNGSVYPTGILSVGTHTFWAEASTCSTSIVRNPITVTVNPLPNINVVTSNTMLCPGETSTLFVSGANTQSWSTGPTSSSLVISPITNTTYTVIGTDLNGCSNSFAFTQSVTICLGTENLITNPSQILIHPNPSSGKFMVSGINSETDVLIYNSIGELIIRSKTIYNNYLINLSEYATGIYFIQLNQDSKQTSFKIVKH